MSGPEHMDPALRRLHEHVRSLRTEHPATTTTDPDGRIDEVLGRTPVFPGQFLYVIDYRANKVVCARGFERVLGYPDTEVDLDLIWGTWHPDDAPTIALLTEVLTRKVFNMEPPLQPFGVTLLVDYRVRKANGGYMKVMRHSSILDVDEHTGKARNALSVCMDISSLKTNDRVGWQLAGPEAARLKVEELAGIISHLEYRPTPREMDVIRALAKGSSSKEIAAELGISLLTVNTHRRNLLERTGLRNTTAIVRKAMDMGWL